jgi:hypothetical protein
MLLLQLEVSDSKGFTQYLEIGGLKKMINIEFQSAAFEIS